jgi:ribonuclease HII
MIGIDEVGRGCWAGPLVVAAVRLKQPIFGLKDSKKLSRQQREKLYRLIEMNADIGLAVIMPAVVDKLGLGRAVEKAFVESYKQLSPQNEVVVVDGNINYLAAIEARSVCEIKADSLYPEVSAASIYAKVYRDNYMIKLAEKYPNYGFDKHVGYGTKIHSEALGLYGPIKGIHRFSYKPIKQLLL